MSLAALLDQVVGILENVGVPYMLTGSLAASYHGAPRSTQDIDLVIEAVESHVEPLAAAFEAAGHYVSLEAAHEAVRGRGQFNIIEPHTGWEIDLIVRKDRSFSRAEFERRFETEALGRRVFLVSAEDLVVAKLEWARLSESERQLRDVAGILAVQGDSLDHDYLAHWVDALDLRDLWQSVTGEP